MNLKEVRNIIKESIKKLQLNENVVCATEAVVCECTGGLPSQGSTTCTGSKITYCNGGIMTDCMCCADMGRGTNVGGGKPGLDMDMIYKRR